MTNDFLTLFRRLPAYFEKRAARIVNNTSHDVYSEWSSLNATILKQPTPWEMLHKLTEVREDTEALINGKLLHMAVFEPDILDQHIVLEPEDTPKKPTKTQVAAFLSGDPKRVKRLKAETVAAIQWWQNFEGTLNGRRVLDTESYDKLHFMRDAVLRHHFAREIINAPGRSEASIEVWDPEWQVMRKARYDRLPGQGASFLLDLKSTRKPLTDSAIRSEVFAYGYDVQFKSYMDVLTLATGDERKQFYGIFTRNAPPYMTRVYEINRLMPAPSFLHRANDLLYAAETTQPGRLPMFCNAAREFIRRIQEKHPDPAGAWEAYEHEGARLLELN
jgi:hypothetical protein